MISLSNLTCLKCRSPENATRCAPTAWELSWGLPRQFSARGWNTAIFADFVRGPKFSAELQVPFSFLCPMHGSSVQLGEEAG